MRAFTDALTDLKNRRALDHVLARLCGTEAQFALMHLDLDKFKAVNDTLGHAVGDMVLKNVSSIMLEETRADDTAIPSQAPKPCAFGPWMCKARVLTGSARASLSMPPGKTSLWAAILQRAWRR